MYFQLAVELLFVVAAAGKCVTSRASSVRKGPACYVNHVVLIETVFYISTLSLLCSATHNDLVDGDKDQLHEKANKAHDHKSSCCPKADLVKLLSIRLRASIDKPDAVLGKFLEFSCCVHVNGSRRNSLYRLFGQ